MSSKAVSRKMGALFATAFALASVFNTGAANAAFQVSGDVSGPSFTDRYGIETPGCKNDQGQTVEFFAAPHMRFVEKNLRQYTDHEAAFSEDLSDGPAVYYDYEMLGMFPVSYRNFVLYQACMLNYSADQALRVPINAKDYPANERQADCSAIIHLRDEKKLSKKDLELTVSILGIQDLDEPLKQPPTPKNVRRGEVITQCYYQNMTAGL